MGTELILWPGCVSCALLAASGCVQMARTKGGWREKPAWTAPLTFTSAALTLLVVLGTLALLPWLVIALVPLAVVAARAARAWREIARLQGRGAATAAVLGGFAGRLRDALWNAREDLRDLGGTLRALAGRSRNADDPPRSVTRAGFIGGLAAATRHVPNLMGDGCLGDAPAAGEVEADLMAAGAVVPVPWEALAEYVRNFDPDGEEAELLEFVAGCAAGVLVLAESLEDLAGFLLNEAGLDPAYARGIIDVAAETADFSGAFALLDRRYHDVYEGIHEHVEAGGSLPADARRWFGAHGGAPEGGAAA